MTRGSSRVFRVDPAQPKAPAELKPPDGGRLVVLLADPAAREAGWAGPLAIDLAERWASGDCDVILADGDLTTSVLHDLVGTPNVEGVSDVVRYGASTDRVARPVGSRSFRFVPKGTIVADPEAVYGETRWSDWFLQVRDSGAVLVLCLPSEVESARALADDADRVVLLTVGDAAAPDDERVFVVRAETSAAVSDAPEETPATPATEASVEREDLRVAVSSAGSGRTSTGKASQWRLGTTLLLALLVVLIAAVVAAWLGLISIPGITGSVSTG